MPVGAAACFGARARLCQERLGDQAALVAISVHLIQIGSQAMLIGVGFLTAEPGQRHVPVTAPPGADAADDAR